jgi:hypothetical protein
LRKLPPKFQCFTNLKSQFVTSSCGGVRKVADMEAEYDEQFAVVFKAIRELMDARLEDKTAPKKPKRKIGFT